MICYLCLQASGGCPRLALGRRRAQARNIFFVIHSVIVHMRGMPLGKAWTAMKAALLSLALIAAAASTVAAAEPLKMFVFTNEVSSGSVDEQLTARRESLQDLQRWPPDAARAESSPQDLPLGSRVSQTPGLLSGGPQPGALVLVLLI
jgi:hypothetical protein